MEFQWYTNNRSNSFCEEGYLHIRPTLTSDVYGETFLWRNTFGNERVGSMPMIIKPVRSAKIRTMESFAFKYGKVEINAKMPSGDWLLPAIWFLPRDNAYGAWPASGSIDMAISRGNRNYSNSEGKHMGIEQFTSALHFGPFDGLDEYQTSQFMRNSKSGMGFNNDFHRYQMEWTPGNIWSSHS